MWIGHILTNSHLLFSLPCLIPCFVLCNDLLMFLVPLPQLINRHMVPILNIRVVLAFQLVQIFFKSGELSLEFRLKSVTSIIHRCRLVTQNWNKCLISIITPSMNTLGVQKSHPKLELILGCCSYTCRKFVPSRLFFFRIRHGDINHVALEYECKVIFVVNMIY